jgi:hypothetical protein
MAIALALTSACSSTRLRRERSVERSLSARQLSVSDFGVSAQSNAERSTSKPCRSSVERCSSDRTLWMWRIDFLHESNSRPPSPPILGGTRIPSPPILGELGGTSGFMQEVCLPALVITLHSEEIDGFRSKVIDLFTIKTLSFQ